MTPGRLSRRDEFTPVPSHDSTFVYMIPPQIPGGGKVKKDSLPILGLQRLASLQHYDLETAT